MSAALTPEQESALAVDYEDYYTVHELSIMYRISHRTVYRVLSRKRAKLRGQRTRRRRREPPEKKPKELKPCGTNAGYHRHRRAGEYPCLECSDAHVEDGKKYYKRKPRKLKPCGTNAAHLRHKRNGEEIDEACRIAHNEYNRKMWARRQKKRKKVKK